MYKKNRSGRFTNIIKSCISSEWIGILPNHLFMLSNDQRFVKVLLKCK